MTGAERLTLDRVLTEVINLRREVSGEITGLRTEVNTHFEKLDGHLTNQDSRLRLVEIYTATVKTADDERLRFNNEKAVEAADSRVGKRWLIGTMIAVTSIIVGILTFVIPFILRVLFPPY